jgi:AcrR family transcriptional regulator
VAQALTQGVSRRDRVRAATIEEIKQTARKLLVSQGPDAVSLRAIAREMGMTAPALYRYFGSHDELIKYVVADIFTEIAADIHTAIELVTAEHGQDFYAKLAVACHEFRRWSLAHKPEFGLLFGSPLPALEHLHDDICAPGAMKFGGTFFALFADLWQHHPFGVPADSEIAPELLAQLARYRDGLGAADMPAGAMLTFLRCWVRLYGMVSLEVFGHLSFALDDAGPMFDYTVAELAELVGLDRGPATRGRAPGAGRSALRAGAPRPRSARS